MEVHILDDHPNLSRLLLRKVWTAARGCYSQDTPYELWVKSEKLSDEKMLRTVRDQVIESGHLSCLRHAAITYSIAGISRSCSHQLVRHHSGVDVEQQSQRYVTANLAPEDFVLPSTIRKNPQAKEALLAGGEANTKIYQQLRELGIPDEDARAILPNATPTNLTVTINLNALINLCHERLCRLSQEEIRLLTAKIRAETVKTVPWIRSSLVIKCQKAGVCFESRNKDNSCGIRPYVGK